MPRIKRARNLARREVRPPQFKAITLEKVRRGKCAEDAPPPGWLRPRCARLGQTYMYTYKALTADKALQRAANAIRREWPDEDRMDWKAVT